MKKLLAILVACLMPICLIAGSGDVNGDGKVNKAYVNVIIDFIMGKASVAKEAMDVNNDGKVNAADIVEFIKVVNEDVNDLPEVLVATEDIGDWSEMRICKDGTFMLSKDVNNVLREVNLLCPDDTQGLIFSSININADGYPVDVVIENIRLSFTWADDKNFDVIIFDSDGNIYKYENLILQEAEASLARTRVPAVDQKPVIAKVGGALNALSGAVSLGLGTAMVVTSGMLEAITAGAATPVSGPGVVLGTLSIQDGVRDIYIGLLNATSNDYYETNNPLLSKARDEMIKRCVVPRIPDRYFAYLVDDKNQSLYNRIGWANLGLGIVSGLLSDIRPAYTSDDLRKDIMDNVYTGLYKDVTYNSVTLRGYVNPYILSDPNGAFDTEYGILIYSNDNDRQHKGISNGNGGMIEYSFDKLKHGTTYYYRTYYNDKTHSIGYLSDIKSFQTKQYSLPTITDFKVTESQYSKGAFSNDGKSYDYCFNVSVTISFPLVDRENVEDWGYVYEDPEGKVAHISIIKLGSNPYIDTRYAYFRNEPVSTVRLYGYVKYRGDEDYYYGEKHDYEVMYSGLCPDNNHPHMIDLGLPSGKKWSCCNIGASLPSEVGGYYAWGETETKPQYGDGTYKFFINYVTSQYGDWVVPVYTHIGTDISGTNYDVAHVKWGNGWRMPTMYEVKELKENCSSSWYILNGKEGRLYVGPNGNRIFLPAGGWYTSSFSSSNHYWSSTLDPYDTSCESSKYGWYPYVLDLDDHSDSYCSRGGGIPIRPIISVEVSHSRMMTKTLDKHKDGKKEYHPVIEKNVVIKY